MKMNNINSFSIKTISFFLITLTFTVLLTGVVHAIGEFGSKDQGVAEGTGTYFSVTDSSYLNVSMETSHEVQAIVQSSPGFIDLYIYPRYEEVVSLIVSGFEPNKTYYKYVDTFSSGVQVTTDETGSISFIQRIGEGVHLFFKETPSTIYVSETGWSDPNVGVWNPVSRTATLGTDLNDSIQVTANEITLDGSGHTVNGNINLTGQNNITVKDFIIRGEGHGPGVECFNASRIHVLNNDISIGRGVHLTRGGGNIVEGNIFSGCHTGVFVSIYSWGNEVINNTFDNCEYGMQYLAFSGANVSGNTFTNNGEGIYLFGSDGNTFTNNEFINNGIGLGFICNESGSGHKPNYNKIYNNNFLGNTVQAYICGLNNSLNLDMPEGGNHWSDWTAPDDNSDGIVDLPYVIHDSYNQYVTYDNLPWVTTAGWLVNQAPIFDSIGPQDVIEYSTLSFIVSASDPDGNNVVSLISEDLPVGASFDVASGLFTWMPIGDQAGVYTVKFSATDDGEPPMTGHMDVLITVGEIESPTDLTNTITEIITEDETMPEAVENSYLANLKKVNTFINEGKVKAAINQLEAFIHKTEQDVEHGIIDAVEGDLYIMMAQDTINLLSGV